MWQEFKDWYYLRLKTLTVVFSFILFAITKKTSDSSIAECLVYATYAGGVFYLFTLFHLQMIDTRTRFFNLTINVLFTLLLIINFFQPLPDFYWMSWLFFFLIIRISALALANEDRKALRTAGVYMLMLLIEFFSRGSQLLNSLELLWNNPRISILAQLVIMAYLFHSTYLLYSELDENILFKIQTKKREKERNFYTNSFALVSHHLKTPLNTALTTAENARFRYDEIKETYTFENKQYERLLKSIDSSCELAHQLVANQKVLNSLFESDTILLNELLHKAAVDKKVHFENHLMNPMEINAAEAFSIQMALTTFIENSLQYAKQVPTIYLCGDQFIEIKDNGPGLPKEVFGIYGNKNIGTSQNSGIGVYHTKQLLESVGWEMRLLPEKGFAVRLSTVQHSVSSSQMKEEVAIPWFGMLKQQIASNFGVIN